MLGTGGLIRSLYVLGMLFFERNWFVHQALGVGRRCAVTTQGLISDGTGRQQGQVDIKYVAVTHVVVEVIIPPLYDLPADVAGRSFAFRARHFVALPIAVSWRTTALQLVSTYPVCLDEGFTEASIRCS